jgi:exoribonuclease R
VRFRLASEIRADRRSAAETKLNLDSEAVAQVAQQCNTKREAGKTAGDASQHLFLCVLIHRLTTQYGPVIRPAQVIGVLDEAFDVVIPDFGIEKRVHVDQMPIEVSLASEAATCIDVLSRTTSTTSTTTRSPSTGRRASTLSSGSPSTPGMPISSSSARTRSATPS